MNRNRRHNRRIAYGVWLDPYHNCWVASRQTPDGIQALDFAFEEDARNQVDDWKFWDKHGAIV